ncbi:hypothetical protein FDA77_19370 [Clostridium botulinum]|uniref:hypothetical protein n=1 Tax=Clostridium botulinum TaxID=1491 RepID=UPI0013F0C1ED|nr:hypothetical protein [Clostridium botulinum]MBY6798145.1 hypothetical protein [Clostridium botulinum]MBY6867881.1 hypothetical protein [Clostridium botulinum]NFI47973.1 hypothetical protein [Clostridium botulinum]NFJ91980.1 hypothetical protein [Clostridium botulinum]NFR74466.1 hypothetical protein [Clostridium botulinum]
MSDLISANTVNHFPSSNQKYHDLAMLYLKNSFDFSNGSPEELLIKYKDVISKIKSADTKPKI